MFRQINRLVQYILLSQTQFFLGGRICTQVQNETDSYHRGSGSYRSMAKSMRTRSFVMLIQAYVGTTGVAQLDK
jgi:hypothetical protein